MKVSEDEVRRLYEVAKKAKILTNDDRAILRRFAKLFEG